MRSIEIFTNKEEALEEIAAIYQLEGIKAFEYDSDLISEIMTEGKTN